VADKTDVNEHPPQPRPDNTHGVSDASQKSGSGGVVQVYESAQLAYQKELDQYWQGVDQAKLAHTMVTSLPPEYVGPKKPAGYDPPKSPSTLPTVDDMLANWNKFAPLAAVGSNLPTLAIDEGSEAAFKKAYARESINIGSKYGLTSKETQTIVESIYTFEDAGTGTRDLLSGVSMRLTVPDSQANQKARRNIHPASTAIGYNQLLMATSLRFIDGSSAINDRLSQLAKENPQRAAILNQKNELLTDVQHAVHKELLAFGKNNPGKYFSANGQPDEQLYTDFAKSQISGSNGLTGRQMSAAVQAFNLDRDIGPVLQAQQLNDIFQHGFKPSFRNELQQKFSRQAGDYLPAAIEMANLAGGDEADQMLKPQNANYPTDNFFDRGGYEANPLTNRRTADELLVAIYSRMHSGKQRPVGMQQMDQAFTDQK